MLTLASIYLGGILSLLVAGFHTRFYRLFGWAEELGKLSVANRKIIYTIHLALLLLLFLLGGLTLLYAPELAASRGPALGFNLGCAAFWSWRFIWQLAYFKAPTGRRLTPLGLILSVTFLLLAGSYLLPVLIRVG